jgi:hypothetical protein
MKDPRRLLDGDGTALERTLLGAMAAERPPLHLHRKMRLGLGLAGVGTTAKVAAASVGHIALAAIVVAGVVAGGVALVRREGGAPAPAAPAATVRAPAVTARTPEAAPAAPVTNGATDTNKARVVRREPAARRTAETVATNHNLREEIRLLDDARSAIRGGTMEYALRVLANYEQRFPRGQFRQEMQVLRMEALKRTGENERAEALAKRFLAEHPKSPHRERVEEVGK